MTDVEECNRKLESVKKNLTFAINALFGTLRTEKSAPHIAFALREAAKNRLFSGRLPMPSLNLYTMAWRMLAIASINHRR
jgi:hypothetical protein